MFSIVIFVFLGFVVFIVIVGIVFICVGDWIVDFIGLGEAFIGGVLLGGIFFLFGVMIFVMVVWDGYVYLLFSNVVGGIVV